MKLSILPLVFVLALFACSSDGNNDSDNNPQPDTLYYPTTDATWETVTAESLGWNTAAFSDLYAFLELKNTKSFMILYNGRIVSEQYFNGHSAQSLWYWASAGKTLTTACTGIAAEQGLLNVNAAVSTYLGAGWTSLPANKEQLIKVSNLLTMTSGLDDSLGDSVAPENLQYVADAGTRWAYHNVYVKLQDVVSEVANKTWATYFNENLRDKIGMNGFWFSSGEDLSVYRSNTKSMARFGLLMSRKGKWFDQQIVPEAFCEAATQTSQNLNRAYGYMWWINGESTYRLPQVQFQFNGSLIPSAPADMYCALGKNDQKIYIVPSRKLVIIRMGDSADGTNFALSDFDYALWQKINAVIQ